MLFPIVQVHHLNRVGIRPTFIFSSCHTLLLRKPMCMNVLVSSREHFIKELLYFIAFLIENKQRGCVFVDVWFKI